MPFQSILLIDDHAAVLEGIRNVLTARYARALCRTATSASEAKWILAREPPDLIVLDLSIGKDSGLELMESIKAKITGVIFISLLLYSQMY